MADDWKERLEQADPGEEEIEILDIEGGPGEGAVPVSATAADVPDPSTSPAGEAERLRAELAALDERFLRLRADFDNFRKRTERERVESRRYVLADPLRDLLPVLDNFERALAAPGGAEDVRRGVEMIARQLREVLRRYGLAEVSAEGARFDPSLHEAVAREESPEVEQPTVVDELQRGYLLHDRLLRPAMVKVAVPPDRDGEPADPAGAEAEPGGEEA